MLKMITKEVTDLVIRRQYETALPIAMDAVQKAQALYWPRDPLKMVPMYLLAVKVRNSTFTKLNIVHNRTSLIQGARSCRSIWG